MTQKKKASPMKTTVGSQGEEEPCENRRSTWSGDIDLSLGFSDSQFFVHSVGNSYGKFRGVRGGEEWVI